MYHTYSAAVVASAVLTATLLVSQAAPAIAQSTRNITLESGTVIPVKLRDTLSSTDSHKGDRFTAVLQSEDTARSLRLPAGTYIEGTVSAVRSMQDKDPGVISLSFDRMIMPNESSYQIRGSLIGLDDKSVTRSSNGRLVARADHKNKTLLYAGYGAGAGLILGAITKGNTILDTLIGGGLGYLLGTLDKSHGDPRDVVLKPNTELGVRLDRSVSFRTYDEGTGTTSSDRESYRRSQRDQNGVSAGSDSDRDPYDDQTGDYRVTQVSNSYQILNQYNDIRDNGGPIRALVNGQDISFLPNARPFISGGVVMVPAIPVLRAERDHYTYSSNRFTAYGPGESLTATFGNRAVSGSGTHRYVMPATVQRRHGTVYVPMQFLAIVTGQRLTFDRDSQTMELGGSRESSQQP